MSTPSTSAPRTNEPDGRAFDLPALPGTTCSADAALFLHGLTGSPFEMRHVAERLHRDGMRCLGPVMPGHGGNPRALAGLPWHAWVEGARRSLFELKGARRTFVVGCSMGALVACVLAHEHPDRVDGLALLAPALRLSRAIRLAGLLAGTRFAAALPPIPKGPSDVRDPEMRRRNPALPGVPLSALAELLALEQHVDRILPGVAAPALVVAGARDHTVTLSGARRVARRIGTGPADLVVLKRSQHLVGIDVERDRCAEEVARFFAGIRPFGSAPTQEM
ncbi:MAG TPA: alpha/beta fold hydrolase [Anaeromyxobacteraceae bacterium]|nr:alpha/beta fold hydrolase [Anaeromyxobacteraceae bacterium]